MRDFFKFLGFFCRQRQCNTENATKATDKLKFNSCFVADSVTRVADKNKS